MFAPVSLKVIRLASLGTLPGIPGAAELCAKGSPGGAWPGLVPALTQDRTRGNLEE